MKAELRERPHKFVPGAFVVEIWWNGEFVGEVVGADGPGVRVISKYTMVTEQERGYPNMTTVLCPPTGG